MERNVFVIGASAGGVQALSKVVRHLPADFGGAVFIVMHLAPDRPSHLQEILQRASHLPVIRPEDGDDIQFGRIYVAAPNRHLMLEGGRIRMTSGPKQNRSRPAVDVLFRSAAWAYGPRVTGIILTGALDDGTAGLYSIKQRGGTAIVQDPAHAFCDGMPASAIRHVTVDHVLQLPEIGAKMLEISTRQVDEQVNSEPPEIMDSEIGIARGDYGRMDEILDLGELSPFTCPECHGVLVKIVEGSLVRFRCHTGHGFTLNHLLAELTRKNEDAIMSALRSLEETELLLRHASGHFRETDSPEAEAQLLRKVEQVRRQAVLVKQAAMGNEIMTLETLETGTA